MSTEAITDFRQTIRGNAALESAIAGLVSETGEFDAAGAVELGSSHGFSFTEAEVLSYEIGEDEELSDFELEMVSAGYGMSMNDDGA